jgi:hypothetical protein
MEQHGSRWIMTKHSAFCLESFTLRRCATIWPQRWYGEVVAGSCYIVLLYNLLFVAEARVIIRSHWHPMISIYFGCQWCQNKENDTSPTSPVGSMMFDASAMRQRLQWSNVLKSGGWCLQCRPRRCNGSGQGLAALGGHGLEVSIDQRPSMWPLKSLNWFETDGFLRAKEVQQLEFIWFYYILLISCLLSLSTLMTQRKYRTNMFAQRPSQYYVLFWKSILSKESKSVKSLENMSEP